MTARGPRHTASKLLLLGSLYFAQGLPYGFFTQALPVFMRKQRYSLGSIGLSTLLAIPWALKFLWAPWVDRFTSTRWGRRASWIVPLQLLTAVTLVFLGLVGSPGEIPLLLASSLVLNLFAATQDIATDGLAVELLRIDERGLANGVQVAGYRVGMVVGGGVILMLFSRLGWVLSFASMALLSLLALLPLFWLGESTQQEDPAYLPPAGSSPGPHFLRREGVGALLLVVVTFKMGDWFGSGMVRPLLVDLGMTLADIGWIFGTVGFVAGLLGALAGGALVNRLGRYRALVTFGLIQAFTVASYGVLVHNAALPLVMVIAAVEHFAGGMATAALFTVMMDFCRREQAGTDYTVQASGVVFATLSVASISGFSARASGYGAHFVIAGVMGLCATGIAALLYRRVAGRFGGE